MRLECRLLQLLLGLAVATGAHAGLTAGPADRSEAGVLPGTESMHLAAAPAGDISGRYQSVISTKRGKRRSVVDLVQSGDEIVVTWEARPDDRLVGKRSGDRIVFEWYNSRAGYDLVGAWTVMDAGQRIEGRWERPDGASGGKWILTRIP